MIGRKRKRFTPFGRLDASVSLYPKEPIIMPKKIVRKDEQIRLIMECRQSGLSIVKAWQKAVKISNFQSLRI